MSEPTITESLAADTPATDAPDAASTPELVDELLVEEISIDGMCGVY